MSKRSSWKTDKEEDSKPVDPPVKVPTVKVADPDRQCGSCAFFQPHAGSKCYGECSEPERRRTVGIVSSCAAWTVK